MKMEAKLNTWLEKHKAIKLWIEVIANVTTFAFWFTTAMMILMGCIMLLQYTIYNVEDSSLQGSWEVTFVGIAMILTSFTWAYKAMRRAIGNIKITTRRKKLEEKGKHNES